MKVLIRCDLQTENESFPIEFSRNDMKVAFHLIVEAFKRFDHVCVNYLAFSLFDYFLLLETFPSLGIKPSIALIKPKSISDCYPKVCQLNWFKKFHLLAILGQLSVNVCIMFFAVVWSARHYAIILDCGSTGSRLLAFTFRRGAIDQQLQLVDEIWLEVKPGKKEIFLNLALL